MKITWRFLAGAFVITTFFIAPFLKNNDSIERMKEQAPTIIGLSNNIVRLTADLAKKDGLIQIQNATIQSYQAENTTLHGRLSDIESANDPSAKAVKKRALILCKQLEDFYLAYRTNEAAMTDQMMEQGQLEAIKLGWPPPTNAIERADWDQKRNKSFYDGIQKEEASDAQWAAKFTTEYYGRVREMRDELASLGLRDKELDLHVDGPFFTSAHWSHDLTMRIEYLTSQIKE